MYVVYECVLTWRIPVQASRVVASPSPKLLSTRSPSDLIARLSASQDPALIAMGGVEDGAARVIADDVVERGDVAVNSNFESSLARIVTLSIKISSMHTSAFTASVKRKTSP